MTKSSDERMRRSLSAADELIEPLTCSGSTEGTEIMSTKSIGVWGSMLGGGRRGSSPPELDHCWYDGMASLEAEMRRAAAAPLPCWLCWLDETLDNRRLLRDCALDAAPCCDPDLPLSTDAEPLVTAW